MELIECEACGHGVRAEDDLVARVRQGLHCPSRFADFSVVREASRLGRFVYGECGSRRVRIRVVALSRNLDREQDRPPGVG